LLSEIPLGVKEENMYSFYTRPAFWIGNQGEMFNYLKNDYNCHTSFKEPEVKVILDDINISVFKDGMIGLDFPKIDDETLSTTLKRLEYFNALSFSIYNSINLNRLGRKCSLNPYNLEVNDFLVSDEDSTGFGDGTSYNTKIYKDRYDGLFGIQRVLFFTSKDIVNLLNQFEKELKSNKLWLYSYLNRFISHYKAHNFLEAFISSFFLIEVLINKLWDDYIKNNKDKLNQKRREFLKGRDITLAIKTNFLQLNDAISVELFEKIDNLRKKRNMIAHDIEKIAMKGDLYDDDFGEVFEVINDLVYLNDKIVVKLVGGYSARSIT